MRGEWFKVRVWFALAWRDLLIDLSNFYLIQYRDVRGFLISGKNSGTHWLRHMLSHAMARRYGLPPPAYSSGRKAEDFMGHPNLPRKHPRLPFIAVSHNLPSRMLSWPWLRWLVDLPPIVVLVRDPKEAMLSHFVKWRDPLALDFEGYLQDPSTARKQLANAYWYIDFFNRWGRMAASAPDMVLVVRYEDLKAEPAWWLRRISDHLGLGLDAAAIQAAMAVSSREAIRSTLDPAYGEVIVPDENARSAVRLSRGQDAKLTMRFNDHLHYDFGYGLARPSNRPVNARWMGWAKAAFVLMIAYAAFSEVGRPYFDLSLSEPWSRIELAAVFSILTLLGPQLFPHLKTSAPAMLLTAGAAVELAQHSHLAPGVGSVADLAAEIGGIAVSWATMAVLGDIFGQGHRTRRA